MTTSGSVSRAQFLRGNFSGARAVVRPPWALAEAAFVQACTRCDECVSVCPEKILEKGRGGFPQVNFAAGACTFCRECIRVCRPGAIRSAQCGDVPWRLVARIGEACLAARRVVCRTCGEHCPTGAIRFPPVVGAVATPQLESARCTGCGACFAPCPSRAIVMAARSDEE